MEIALTRILLLCHVHDMNLKQLEKLLGFSNGSIRKWPESIPSADKVKKVADYFGVSIDYLMGRTDNMNSHKGEASVDTLGILEVLYDVQNNVNDLQNGMNAVLEAKIAQAKSKLEQK